MKASTLKVLMAAMLLLQGCSSGTTDSTELASILDEAVDREGVPPGARMILEGYWNHIREE